jgi:hypothetical protein
MPVARLVKLRTVSLVAQRVVDDDVFLQHRLAVFEQGQARAEFLGRAGLIKAHVEIVAADGEGQAQVLAGAAQRDLLNGVALGDGDEPVEAENGPDQAADQEQHHAEMDRVDAEARPAAVFTEHHEALIGRLDAQGAHPARDVRFVGGPQRFRTTGIAERRAVRKIAKPCSLKGGSAHEQDPAVGRQAVRRTDDDVGGEQHHQDLEPPGMVHVEEAQHPEEAVERLAEGGHVGGRLAVLGDEGPDDGGDRQRQQQDNGQLDRGQQFPDGVHDARGCFGRAHG